MHVHNTIKTADYVKNKTNNSKHLLTAICQLHSIHLQKEVKSKQNSL